MADEALDDAGVIIPEDEEATNSNKTSVEDTVALQEKLDKAEQAKSQILARAKKAEEELKKLKEAPADTHISNQDPYFADELRLISQGVDGQAILKAKIIAKGSGITLMDAIKDDAVVAYIKDIKEIERKEKAKLGASRGSGESQDESDIKPEMSREEHQKAFKKLMG